MSTFIGEPSRWSAQSRTAYDLAERGALVRQAPCLAAGERAEGHAKSNSDPCKSEIVEKKGGGESDLEVPAG
jgi:hypothetical protein